MRPLNRKFRTEIAQRSLWEVQPATEIPGVPEPNLVDEIRVGRPGVADVQVLLAPVELLYRPGNVAIWLSAGGIQGRHRIGPARIKVTSAQPLVAVSIVIQFNYKFVGVKWAGSRSLPAGCPHVGHWNRRKSDRRACGIEEFLCERGQERGPTHR